MVWGSVVFYWNWAVGLKMILGWGLEFFNFFYFLIFVKFLTLSLLLLLQYITEWKI